MEESDKKPFSGDTEEKPETAFDRLSRALHEGEEADAAREMPLSEAANLRRPEAVFWRRLAAFIVDFTLLWGVLYGIAWLGMDLFAPMGAKARLIGLGVVLAYYAVLDSRIGNGRTLGKRLLGLKLTDRDGLLFPLVLTLPRTALLFAPFFLNGLPAETTASSVLQALGTLGLLGAMGYLALFNRATRQSLHDLLIGSYVIRYSADHPEPEGRVGKKHLVVLILWFAAVAGLILSFAPMIKKQMDAMGLQAPLETARQLPDVMDASILWNRIRKMNEDPPTETLRLQLTLRLDRRPVMDDPLFYEVAEKVLPRVPMEEEPDSITTTLTYAADLGLASARLQSSLALPQP